jgi:hypothetical protein
MIQYFKFQNVPTEIVWKIEFFGFWSLFVFWLLRFGYY